MPFWFWNDALDEAEIVRQMADFEAHGVYGFVIHPRVGLPRDIGWMSDRMLHFMRIAVEAAAQRNLKVILYDDGMYPSGSSSGQVVAENPAYACRCLARLDLADGRVPSLPPGHNLVSVAERQNGDRFAVIDRPVDAYIRGLHYVGEGPEEDTPPAADLLNPDAVAMFVRLVYDRYAECLGDHFGSTIQAIFTDEPGLLGKCRERDVWPGTVGILEHVNRTLGYDFAPHLAALWCDEEPDAERRREDYRGAVASRLEETYYRELSAWCGEHGIALTGHPSHADEIGLLRYFHIPGQDTVWRWVLPDEPSALEGPESTQGKCSSSAMIHLGRRRNSNECFGAYGHGFTWEEMKWLVDWCFVRGVNLLYPHAFFYSVRGPRRDERPPDVGPNSPWWEGYRAFADYCRRMCWLNADGRHVCSTAILGESSRLPWAAAKVCFQHQRDFNYLEARHLWEDAAVDAQGIRIAGMHYQALIVEASTAIPPQARAAVETLAHAGRLIVWSEAGDGAGLGEHAVLARSPQELVAAIDDLCPVDVSIAPASEDVRVRHVAVDREHFYMVCNEGQAAVRLAVDVAAPGKRSWLDPWSGASTQIDGPPELELAPYTTMVVRVSPDD